MPRNKRASRKTGACNPKASRQQATSDEDAGVEAFIESAQRLEEYYMRMVMERDGTEVAEEGEKEKGQEGKGEQREEGEDGGQEEEEGEETEKEEEEEEGEEKEEGEETEEEEEEETEEEEEEEETEEAEQEKGGKEKKTKLLHLIDQIVVIMNDEDNLPTTMTEEAAGLMKTLQERWEQRQLELDEYVQKKTEEWEEEEEEKEREEREEEREEERKAKRRKRNVLCGYTPGPDEPDYFDPKYERYTIEDEILGFDSSIPALMMALQFRKPRPFHYLTWAEIKYIMLVSYTETLYQSHHQQRADWFLRCVSDLDIDGWQMAERVLARSIDANDMLGKLCYWRRRVKHGRECPREQQEAFYDLYEYEFIFHLGWEQASREVDLGYQSDPEDMDEPYRPYNFYDLPHHA